MKIRLIVSILLAIGWMPALAAAEDAAQPPVSGTPQATQQPGGELQQDREQLRQAEGEVHGDMKQIQQDKQLFRQRMSALESQRAEALKSGEKDQVRALTGQIRQLREEGKERRQQDFKELQQDKEQMSKDRAELLQDRKALREEWKGRDKDNNPPGPRGGPGTNWENPPGPKGGPGVGPKGTHPAAREAAHRARSRGGAHPAAAK